MCARTYVEDRAKADSYETQVCEILKGALPFLVDLSIAPDVLDRQCATDFTLQVKGCNIAVRVRNYPCEYRDLTIRSHRNSGAKTELAKIKEGYGDRYFYGWVDEHNIIAERLLVDLDKLRASGLLEYRYNIPNGDGTFFISIPIRELLDAGCVVAMRVKNW